MTLSTAEQPTEPTQGVGFRQLSNWIGSQTATGLPLIVFICLYPMAIGSLQGSYSGFELPLQTWLWDLLTGLGAAGTLLIARLFMKRRSVSIHLRIWLVAALASALLPILVASLTTSVPSHIVTGIPSAVLAVFGLMLIFTLVLAALIEFRKFNAELLQLASDLQLRRAGLNQELVTRQEALARGILAEINPRLAGITASLGNSDSSTASKKILNLINDIVRPLSQELGDKNRLPSEDFSSSRHGVSIKALIFRLARRLPVAILFTPHLHVIFALVFYGSTMLLAAGTDGLVYLVSFLALQVLAFLTLRVMVRNLTLSHWLLIIINLLLAAIAAWFFVEGAKLAGLPDPEGLVSFVGFGIFLVFVFAGYISIFSTARAFAHQEILETASGLSYLVGELQIRTAALRNQFANGLHGDLQARLQGALVRLERAGNLESEIESVLGDLITLARDLENADSLTSKIAQLDELTLLWEGVCDVTIEQSAEVESLFKNNVGLAQVATEIVKERIVNAVKHSLAEEIDISLQFDGGILVISSRNEDLGLGAKAKKSAGGGSRLLDEVCLSWSLKLDGSDMVFEARLAS